MRHSSSVGVTGWRVTRRTVGRPPQTHSGISGGHVQPVDVEPGRFAYRLVRAELGFDGPGTVEAHCSIDSGEATVVPYTILDPLS